MNKISIALLGLFVLIILNSCSKSDPLPDGATTFTNNSQTRVTITVNGTTKTISSGGAATFSGKGSYSGDAYTSGLTQGGNLVGLKMTWQLDDEFPAAGKTNKITLNVPGTYFYVNIINNSGYDIDKFYANYGLEAQTLDNIGIPADGGTYNIGYYEAYSNSNIRLEDTPDNYYWSWSSLNLTNTENQTITLTATP